MGRPLQDFARAAGPGSESVALGAYLAAERVRGFKTQVPQSRQADSALILLPSPWGPLTRSLWYSQEGQESALDPEVAPLVQQACGTIVPLLQLVARNIWGANTRQSVVMAGQQEGDQAPETEDDDGEGLRDSWSRAELEQVGLVWFSYGHK